jgi:hypothetical protein
MKLRKLTRGPTVCLVAFFALQGCSEKKEDAKGEPVRGLRAYKVSERADNRVRRFPSVLQPADVSVLSFEISGTSRKPLLSVPRHNWSRPAANWPWQITTSIGASCSHPFPARLPGSR